MPLIDWLYRLPTSHLTVTSTTEAAAGFTAPHAVRRNPKFLVASLCVWPVAAGMQACLVTVPRRNLLAVSCLFCLAGGHRP